MSLKSILHRLPQVRGVLQSIRIASINKIVADRIQKGLLIPSGRGKQEGSGESAFYRLTGKQNKSGLGILTVDSVRLRSEVHEQALKLEKALQKAHNEGKFSGFIEPVKTYGSGKKQKKRTYIGRSIPVGMIGQDFFNKFSRPQDDAVMDYYHRLFTLMTKFIENQLDSIGMSYVGGFGYGRTRYDLSADNLIFSPQLIRKFIERANEEEVGMLFKEIMFQKQDSVRLGDFFNAWEKDGAKVYIFDFGKWKIPNV